MEIMFNISRSCKNSLDQPLEEVLKDLPVGEKVLEKLKNEVIASVEDLEDEPLWWDLGTIQLIIS